MNSVNHYKWLEKYLPSFFEEVGVSFDENAGIIGAHGDKCYTYRSDWKEAGIPFPHGVAIYLLSYVREYKNESRDTESGWVDVKYWVIDNYERFKPHLPDVDETDKDILSLI